MLQRKGLVGEASERTEIPDGYHEQSMIHHCGPKTGKGIQIFLLIRKTRMFKVTYIHKYFIGSSLQGFPESMLQ